MDMFEYRVKGGDTLSSIVFKMHGYTSRDARYNGAVAHIMALNPQLKAPNLIFAGNILRISVLPQVQPKVAQPYNKLMFRSRLLLRRL